MLRKRLDVILLLTLLGCCCLAHDGRPEPPPKHGGIVFASGIFDVEAVLEKPKGQYKLYFADTAGQDVPGDTLDAVQLTIRHADSSPEKIPMKYDKASKSWTGSGPVSNSEMSSALLSFELLDIQVQTEIPFATTFHADFSTEPKVARASQPVQLEFAVKDFYGKTGVALQIVHTKPMHLMVVSSDLHEFYHIHPEPTSAGTLRVTHVFPYGGVYHLFADFTPEGGNNVIQPYELKVEGPARSAVPMDSLGILKSVTADGMRMTLTPDRPLRTGEDVGFSMTVVDAKTNAQIHDLQRYLGAWAHIAVISDDLQEFIHVHPFEETVKMPDGREGSPDPIRTATGFRKPGLYKFWAQIQRNDKVTAFPFVFRVEAGNTPVTSMPTPLPADAVLVKVSSAGFEPASVPMTPGKPLKLTFFRQDAQNCGREVVFPRLGIRRELPPGQTVIVDIAPQKTGTLSFACGMNMFHGQLIVQ